jgi:serine protease
VRSYLSNFLTRLGGSSWLSSVTQYTQSNGAHVGNASGSFGGSWIDTSAIPSLNTSTYQSSLAAEARRAAAHFANSTVSASYIIALPHAVRVYQFGALYCAWHSSTATSTGARIAYTNLPYMPDAGPSCGQASVNWPGYDDGVSIVAGHEQAETETDPHLNAWYDSNGNENGDKCAWSGLRDMTFGGTSLGVNEFPTQPLWSNAANGGAGGCVQ